MRAGQWAGPSRRPCGRRRLMALSVATWAAAAGCLGLVLPAAAVSGGHGYDLVQAARGTRSLAAGATVLSYGSSPYSERIGGRRAFDQAKAMVTDATGATYVLGDFRSQVLTIGEEGQSSQQRQLINNNAPYSDIYVARFDKDGKLDWATSWGGEGDDVATDLVWDASTNALYVLGSFKSLAFPEAGEGAEQGLFDGFAEDMENWLDDDGAEAAAQARKARKGRQLWSKRRERVVTRGLETTTEEVAAALAGPSNVFAMKIGARDGAIAWANPLGPGEGVSLAGLVTNADGAKLLFAAIQYNALVSAASSASSSAAGITGAEDALPITPFGSVFDSSAKDDGVADYESYIMCLHERTGLEVRSKSLELTGARNDQLTSIVHDPATSSIYAVGVSDSDELSLGDRVGSVLRNEDADWGASSAFLLKMRPDGAGAVTWQKSLGRVASLEKAPPKVAVDPTNGDLYVTGLFTSPSLYSLAGGTPTTLPNPPSLVRVDKDTGGFLLARALPLAVQHLGIDNLGGLYMAGLFQQPLSFSGLPSLVPMSAMGGDIYVVKYNATRNLVTQARAFGGDANGQYRVNDLLLDPAGSVSICGAYGGGAFTGAATSKLLTAPPVASDGFVSRVLIQSLPVSNAILAAAAELLKAPAASTNNGGALAAGFTAPPTPVVGFETKEEETLATTSTDVGALNSLGKAITSVTGSAVDAVGTATQQVQQQLTGSTSSPTRRPTAAPTTAAPSPAPTTLAPSAAPPAKEEKAAAGVDGADGDKAAKPVEEEEEEEEEVDAPPLQPQPAANANGGVFPSGFVAAIAVLATLLVMAGLLIFKLVQASGRRRRQQLREQYAAACAADAAASGVFHQLHAGRAEEEATEPVDAMLAAPLLAKKRSSSQAPSPRDVLPPLLPPPPQLQQQSQAQHGRQPSVDLEASRAPIPAPVVEHELVVVTQPPAMPADPVVCVDEEQPASAPQPEEGAGLLDMLARAVAGAAAVVLGGEGAEAATGLETEQQIPATVAELQPEEVIQTQEQAVAAAPSVVEEAPAPAPVQPPKVAEPEFEPKATMAPTEAVPLVSVEQAPVPTETAAVYHRLAQATAEQHSTDEYLARLAPNSRVQEADSFFARLGLGLGTPASAPKPTAAPAQEPEHGHGQEGEEEHHYSPTATHAGAPRRASSSAFAAPTQASIARRRNSLEAVGAMHLRVPSHDVSPARRGSGAFAATAAAILGQQEAEGSPAAHVTARRPSMDATHASPTVRRASAEGRAHSPSSGSPAIAMVHTATAPHTASPVRRSSFSATASAVHAREQEEGAGVYRASPTRRGSGAGSPVPARHGSGAFTSTAAALHVHEQEEAAGHSSPPARRRSSAFGLTAAMIQEKEQMEGSPASTRRKSIGHEHDAASASPLGTRRGSAGSPIPGRRGSEAAPVSPVRRGSFGATTAAAREHEEKEREEGEGRRSPVSATTRARRFSSTTTTGKKKGQK